MVFHKAVNTKELSDLFSYSKMRKASSNKINNNKSTQKALPTAKVSNAFYSIKIIVPANR